MIPVDLIDLIQHAERRGAICSLIRASMAIAVDYLNNLDIGIAGVLLDSNHLSFLNSAATLATA